MTTRRKSRRLEVLQEVQGDIRRSPRLRERYSRERSEDPTTLTVTYVATSRPGLSGYLRQKELEQQRESILNESGQSVPSHFDLGQDEKEYRDSGFSGDSEGLSYVPGATTDPQHLYGLDGSEDDEDSDRQHYQTQAGLATTPSPTNVDGDSSGVVGWILSAVMDLLFKLGSLLYLAATAILCLDVIILHRCYLMFTAITCWSSCAASRPWLRCWILPVVLSFLVYILIGGGPVTDETPHNFTDTDETPHYNFTDTDLTQLHFELEASIRKTLSTELRQHVEGHVDKVVKEWAENRYQTELQLTSAALDELKTNLSLEITKVQEDAMEELERRLSEVKDQTGATYITETVMLQTMKTHIQQHIDSAKQQWMKLIQQDLSAVTESVNQLRNDFDKKDKHYSEQFSSLKSLIEGNNSTLTEALLQLVSDLQASSSNIKGLATRVESQSRHLASLGVEVHQVTEAMEQVKESMSVRLEEMKMETGEGLTEEDVARVFAEEMDKSVENRTSVLWLRLSEELKKVVDNREIPASGLTKKDVEELIRIALHRYSADRIAKFDFALENSGGSVLKNSESYPPSLETFSVMGVPVWSVPCSPTAIIRPGVHPGDCWPMNGTSGFALIRLKEAVVVTSVTVEHIPRELTPSGSLSSAPREFRVQGMNETETMNKGEVLGQFTYSIESTPIQEFTVKDVDRAYTHILFEFLSNHGNDNYTCVYRVRVHGHRPN